MLSGIIGGIRLTSSVCTKVQRTFTSAGYGVISLLHSFTCGATMAPFPFPDSLIDCEPKSFIAILLEFCVQGKPFRGYRVSSRRMKAQFL